jgi:hypothetical protein
MPCNANFNADYSGEFSYWNFSMRVKRHIEDRMVGSVIQVGAAGCAQTLFL